ncbi:potassium transporter Kef, partial [Halobacteriales archaeon QS_8_65_32]
LAAELAAFAYDNSLYFSVVTFTTLGYGDSSPTGGLARLLASAEAVSDAFFAALFVFTLGRRVTR